MRISGPAHKYQPSLFDWPRSEGRVLTVAACRNYCGDFMEEVTTSFFTGDRLTTDSRADICPDIELGRKVYGEVKSVGANKEVLVYEARAEKDRKLINEGNTLYYFIWHHTFKVRDGITLLDLRNGLAENLKSLHVFEATSLLDCMAQGPLMEVNKKGGRRGYGSRGYVTGRRLKLNKIDIPLEDPIVESQSVLGRGIEIEIYLQKGLTYSFETGILM